MIVSLTLSIAFSLIVLSAGIMTVSRDPQKIEAAPVALGVMLFWLMALPAQYAALTREGNDVIQAAAGWLLGVTVARTVVSVRSIGKTPRRVTPGWGLVGVLISLSCTGALLLIWAQVMV